MNRPVWTMSLVRQTLRRVVSQVVGVYRNVRGRNTSKGRQLNVLRRIVKENVRIELEEVKGLGLTGQEDRRVKVETPVSQRVFSAVARLRTAGGEEADAEIKDFRTELHRQFLKTCRQQH